MRNSWTDNIRRGISVMALVPVLAWTGPALAQELAPEQILHRGNGAEPQTLDPHRAEGVPASNILRDLYEGLTAEAPNGDLVPGGAERWEISDDGRVYTFYLRRDARWSNGDPVTAADFAYGLRRSADPATLSKYSQILSSIENAEAVIAGDMPPEALGVEVLDDYTLEVRLKAPTPYFLGLLSHSSTYPAHRASIEEHGDRFSRPGNLVGNGAYFLHNWVVQSHVHLKRNPHYWGNADVVLDEVYFHATEDQSSELKRYRAGELHFTNEVPLAQVRWIRENMPEEFRVSTYLGTYYYGFNLTQPPFKGNKALRRALTMAIQREIITEKVTRLGEQPAYSWVPPGVNNYTAQIPEWSRWPWPRQLEEARRLYAEAGYGPDNPLHIELRYNTSENHKKVAVAIAAMLKQNLGVRVNLVNEEWKVFLQNRKQKRVTQLFRAGWIGDYNDAYTFSELMHSKHGINDSAYNSPRYDALLEQASVEGDEARRREILEEAERLMLEDQPIMPIYFYVSKKMVSPRLDGFVPNIMDRHYSKHFRLLAR
ncbi:MAG: peptide ABC transporter substrate-binding protein [Oceanococcaceae bacterium]